MELQRHCYLYSDSQYVKKQKQETKKSCSPNHQVLLYRYEYDILNLSIVHRELYKIYMLLLYTVLLLYYYCTAYKTQSSGALPLHTTHIHKTCLFGNTPYDYYCVIHTYYYMLNIRGAGDGCLCHGRCICILKKSNKVDPLLAVSLHCASLIHPLGVPPPGAFEARQMDPEKILRKIQKYK